MRLTQKLCHQHIGFMFRKNWIAQGKRVPLETGAEEYLKSKGISVLDANEFVKPVREKIKLQLVGFYDSPLPLDRNHPEWKERQCHVMLDTNVLLEGLTQAQVLTKTISSSNSLPESIEQVAEEGVSSEIHEQVKKAILSANVFDCEQNKLPKRIDSERPAFTFQRDLGITDVRRNLLTTFKLVNILERNSNGKSKNKLSTYDVDIVTSFEKDGDLIQLKNVSNLLLTSDTPMKPALHAVESTENEMLPNLYPIKHTVTIPKESFYNFADIYPLKKTSEKIHPHTSFIHFNRSKVSNLYATEVTEEQIKGRALLHSFSTAAAYAKTLYGENVESLPKPVTVQCVQVEGGKFHLGVFQLNTLNLDGTDGLKNVWYSRPHLELFETCNYTSARPTLTGYNPQVINYLNALYMNN